MSDACFCDYDNPDFYDTQSIKAAKIAQCCDECHRTISVGESYERTFVKWEGEVNVYKTCARCLAVKEWVAAHVPCFCWAHGNILNDARETVSEYWHEAPDFWFGWGRRLVAVKRAERWVAK